MTDPNQPHLPELMAPAGDWEALKAAVANGADAVYFGLENHNARYRATNFKNDDLDEVMRYLHAHNVKGYLTFNTLIFSDELPEAVEYVRRIVHARVDAVIVQDLGLACLIRTLAPGVELHGSTQMTLTDPRGIDFVRRELGISRVVLARELSAKDVGAIVDATHMPVEVFIHGALCVAYSGQCLTSESLGGRSANRGQCAQACRLPYELIVDGAHYEIGDKAYLLSPQDLAAYDMVDDLVKRGVSCFKIEGRLKSAQYVAATTRTYRAALDAALAHRPFDISRDQKRDLAQIFSRGFTHAFLDGADHAELVPALFPKSRGIRVGTVERITRRGVVVRVDRISSNGRMKIKLAPGERALKPGDGVVFDEGHPDQDEQGGRVYEVFPLPSPSANQSSAAPQSSAAERRQKVAWHVSAKNPGRPLPPLPSSKPPKGATELPRGNPTTNPADLLEITFGRDAVDLNNITPGAIVWKTDDPDVRRRLEQSYSRDEVPRRVPIDLTLNATANNAIAIRISDGVHTVDVVSGQPLELARKHPLTLDSLREQFGRLGDTPFELRDIHVEKLDPVMAPRSVLNDLRRQAIEKLLAQRATSQSIEITSPDALEQLRAQLTAIEEEGSEFRVGGSAAKDEGKKHRLTADATTQSAIGDRQSAILSALVRSLDQLRAIVTWRGGVELEHIYCDFEDVRKYKDAVPIAHEHGRSIALATTRIIKPGEEGLLRQVASANPDAILVRNLSGLCFFREQFPEFELFGDYSLNVANELTAGLLYRAGLSRLVPSYDLNWNQMAAMLARISPAIFEAVIHQHMPMFHMEHCVFCHTLSTGHDYRDCGRPCDTHKVDLKDRVGQQHPLIADVGCRNTVYNGVAQSGEAYVPRMIELGLRHFRIEMLRESAEEAVALLDRYAGVITGKGKPSRSLSIRQAVTTPGTFDYE